MSAGLPPDHAARVRIVDDLEATLFVEAGAGTGKTTTLVARVMQLVASGRARITEIAAITFTEAAAAELRERIRAALEVAGSGLDASVTSPDAQQRCREALDEVDDAAVSTLHGFAQRILAEFPFEIDLPPGFEVIDDVQASVSFTDRWRVFIDELLDRPTAQRPLLVAYAFGISRSALEAVAHSLHDHWDRLPAPRSDLPEIPELATDTIIAAVDAAIARASVCEDSADALLAHLQMLARWNTRLRSLDDELDRLVVLADAPILSASKMKGRKTNWPAGEKDAVLELLGEAQAAFDHVVQTAKQRSLAHLLDAIIEFTLRSVQQRRREGKLEFHDLLVLARTLLRSDASVRSTLHSRFQALLLDEFQDTDPLQIEIAALIATDAADTDSRAWSELPIPAGRLFVVGDPKQSIYRFRRADISLYQRVHHSVDGELERLTGNFRSRPEILAWINHCFASLMDVDAATDLQARYEALEATRAASVRVAVNVIGGASTRTLAEIRSTEAAEIAHAIERVRDEGWIIAAPTPEDPEATRPAKLDDIAILLPTRTTLPYLEHALEDRGIPMRVESQSMVFATDEVRTILSVLQAVDDPTDEIAIVAALRSPAFACSDRELADWKLAGNRFDYRFVSDELVATHRVAAALRELGGLQQRHVWQSVSETVDHIVRERRLLEIATAATRPRDHWRRVRILADTARSYSATSGASLRGFVTWMQQQLEEGARIVERVVPEPDDHAVRILTVHGAKGLEFPIVILAGLNVAQRARAARTYCADSGAIEARVGRADAGFETPGFEALRQREANADEFEAIRVLYVGATRARDHLIVSLHHGAKDKSLASKLAAVVATAPHLCPVIEPRDVPLRLDLTRPTLPDPIDEATRRRDWIARHDALCRADSSRATSATALAGRAHASSDTDDRDASDPGVDEPWKRGRAGTAIGRAVHAVLQTVDLEHRTDLDAACRAQALAEGVGHHEHEIRALVESVIASPAVGRALTSGRYWREVPVATSIDGIVVDGFIDLLIEGPDGLEVVDYKTDRVEDPNRRAALIDRYEVQAGTYALALARIVERPIARVTLVFARPGEAFEHSITDTERSISRVRALLAVTP